MTTPRLGVPPARHTPRWPGGATATRSRPRVFSDPRGPPSAWPRYATPCHPSRHGPARPDQLAGAAGLIEIPTGTPGCKGDPGVPEGALGDHFGPRFGYPGRPRIAPNVIYITFGANRGRRTSRKLFARRKGWGRPFTESLLFLRDLKVLERSGGPGGRPCGPFWTPFGYPGRPRIAPNVIYITFGENCGRRTYRKLFGLPWSCHAMPCHVT